MEIMVWVIFVCSREGVGTEYFPWFVHFSLIETNLFKANKWIYATLAQSLDNLFVLGQTESGQFDDADAIDEDS